MLLDLLLRAMMVRFLSTTAKNATVYFTSRGIKEFPALLRPRDARNNFNGTKGSNNG